MMSEANLKDIEDAGWNFVVGGKLPDIPYAIAEWHREHPDAAPPDQLVLTQPTVMGPRAEQRKRTTYYQYRAERARRTLHGIDTQVAKAEKAVAGQVPVKRNRFIQLTGGTKTVNRDLEAKARMLAGWKPYVTNLEEQAAEYVIGAYHHLWRIEHAFRMSKHDLKARPVYHRKRESIDAHLAVVFAALAVSHWIEQRTGGASESSFAPSAATGRSRSTPEPSKSRPSSPYPTTNAPSWPNSTANVRTSLAQVGLHELISSRY